MNLPKKKKNQPGAASYPAQCAYSCGPQRINHMIVRYRRQTHTRVWKLSRKDSLFIPQTFTERMALPSASEQMAQGNRYTRPPPNWRIPYSPPMTNQSLLCAPICCDLEPKYSLCLFSTEKQIATNFSLCRRELRNSVPS